MKTVIFDVGHGGQDPGAVSGGVREKDIVLTVFFLIAKKLDGKVKVMATRTTDISQSINTKAYIINHSGADYSVSLHVNAGGGKGSETWVSVYGGESKRLGESIQAEMAKITTNRGVKSRKNDAGGNYYGMIRLPKQPAVIVEMGFIDNYDDRKYLSSPAGQEEIATAIANGVLKFVGQSPTATAKPVSKAKPKDTIEVDGKIGRITIRKLQRVLGAKNIDGILSAQYKPNKKYYPAFIDGVSWSQRYNKAGSPTVRLLQRLVGASPDGTLGKDTAKMLQRFLNNKMKTRLTVDGYIGTKTAIVLQKWLNTR